MAGRKDEFGQRTLNSDEFGNATPQPSTTAMYGHPSSADATRAYGTPETASGGQEQGRRPETVEADCDPTQRRGTTTGEYGRTGVGLMDRAKEKLAEVGGFKEDPGHVTTAGDEGGGGGDDGEFQLMTGAG